MRRITMTHVEAMFKRVVGAARKVGLDTAGWYIQGGSKAMGSTYQLHTHASSTPVHLPASTFLGWTAAEAYGNLQSLAVAWEAVAEIRQPEPVGESRDLIAA